MTGKTSIFSRAKFFNFVVGVILSINFVLFWALPIGGMGLLWKHFAKPFVMPFYDAVDQNKTLRSFAANYIYTRAEHADYFATSLLTVISAVASVVFMFYYQLKNGYLSMWLIYLYYCCWVGIGGRTMGAAYALAHKEGHFSLMYKKWIRSTIGNLFENVIGVWFGNVPWNFTTSHIFIHHRLNGGAGDTFYLWDFDRTSVADFMLYVTRIFAHMTGYSSLKFFHAHEHTAKYKLLMKGVISYLVTAGLAVGITRSPAFVFWMIVQPMICMSYFLALLNVGFHGFLEFDEKGVSIPCVNATMIIDGDDDYFGEDDHMTHHYATNVYYRDLPAHQKSKHDEFKQYKASVFGKLSIVELSIFLLFGLWDELAKHYVDHTGKMTKDEIIAMLKFRARRTETTYEEYEAYLSHPTADARKALVQSLDTDNDSCYARGAGLPGINKKTRADIGAGAVDNDEHED
jgi:hypothetical protein